MSFFRILFFLVFCVGTISSAASAEERSLENYCSPLPRLQQAIHFCWQNTYYDEASDLCYKKIENEVRAHQKQLASAFGRSDKASTSAQNSKFRNTEQDLNLTDSSLKILLSHAYMARKEMQRYQQAMIFPGNPSEGFVAGYQLENHLTQFSCFADPYQAVSQQIARLDQNIIAALERTDKTTLALRQGTRRNNANLGQVNPGQRSAHGSRAPASLLPEGKKQIRHESTITGKILKSGSVQSR